MACWPINADYNPVTNPASPYTTAFDRLIAECSTIGNTATAGTYYPYYFQRQDALNPTKDISIARNQTPPPVPTLPDGSDHSRIRRGRR